MTIGPRVADTLWTPLNTSHEHPMSPHLICFALGLLLSGAALAESYPYTIDDILLDEIWYGEEVDKEEFKDRVVLLELWGIT